MLNTGYFRYRRPLTKVRQRHLRWLAEFVLLAGAGAICGVAIEHVPTLRQAMHAVGIGRNMTANLLGSRFSLAGAPERYVLLYTSPSCRFSMAADSFHRQLFDTATAVGLELYVAVRESSEIAFYEKTSEFRGARFIVGRALPVEPAGTPTILLVEDKVVKRAWSGFQGTDLQRTRVLETITAAKQTGGL